MKRPLSLLLALTCALTLAACGQESKAPDIQDVPVIVSAASLTPEEENILKLVKSEVESHIFDFTLQPGGRSFAATTYELVEGQWEEIGADRMALEEDTVRGRFALNFEYLPYLTNYAVQIGESSTSVRHHNGELEEDMDQLGRSTTIRGSAAEAQWEEEIPLVLQILTSQGDYSNYSPSAFFEPERFDDAGHEHVYALTVTFSQEPLS